MYDRNHHIIFIFQSSSIFVSFLLLILLFTYNIPTHIYLPLQITCCVFHLLTLTLMSTLMSTLTSTSTATSTATSTVISTSTATKETNNTLIDISATTPAATMNPEYFDSTMSYIADFLKIEPFHRNTIENILCKGRYGRICLLIIEVYVKSSSLHMLSECGESI